MLLSSLQLLIAYESLRSRILSMLTSGLSHCFIDIRQAIFTIELLYKHFQEVYKNSHVPQETA